MPEEPKDAELVAGCLDGRRECWDRLVERYSPLIYASIRNTLTGTRFEKRQDMLEDIFQKVFEKLLDRDKLKAVRDVQALPKFLSVMAGRAALDEIRHRNSLEKQTLEISAKPASAEKESEITYADQLKIQQASPSDELVMKEEHALVGTILGELTIKERACVEFFILDGKLQREIAQILGIGENNVASIIRRTKEKLKKAFLEKGFGEI